LLRYACYYRSGTGTSTAAFTSSDKNHVSATKGSFNLVNVVFRCAAAYFWVGTSAETSGKFATDVDFYVGGAE
jgi:hypothetical protein